MTLAGDSPPRRLNWGCGSHQAPGWINSDVRPNPGVDLVADIREGLPLADGCLDYAVSVHALPELAYPELVPALSELRRVLKPGGTLRLVLPDLDRAIDAYRAGDSSYFKVDAEEVSSLGGRLVVQMLWYGYSRSLFTAEFTAELLEKAGFECVAQCRPGGTESGIEEIVVLDNREDESLYVEGRAPDVVDGGELPYNRAVPEELEILDIAQTPTERIRGHLRVQKGEAQNLEIMGWVLGQDSPATEVEVMAGSEVAGRASVVMERPDVAERFPDTPEAATAGFRLDLAARGKGESRLEVRAVLKDGSREELGEVVVKAGRRGLLDAFRRG
ncbi:MAG TPA: methyltransferase domain-containing protein [Solirubrobacterales bacterium]|nr:methyltransferase domain-containing protein [Solirubrobacterales bacterium]